MRILGIDPGLGTIGFGLIEKFGHENRAVKYGVIRTTPGLPLATRLLTIHNDMTELLQALKPDVMAVEELFFNQNITTGIQVSHARGIILLAAAAAMIPVHEYNPGSIKLTVTGYGKATKPQMIKMTQQLLKLAKKPTPDDAADALAVALCHSFHAPMVAALERQGE
ncbi:MAG: crossover junction endodeoxyribonuclease RuvC [Oscillospiraceae bacterium]|nr:crossover junction endodeoxyribonuclease RuvC [Oscillospiraceae bacterium]